MRALPNLKKRCHWEQTVAEVHGDDLMSEELLAEQDVPEHDLLKHDVLDSGELVAHVFWGTELPGVSRYHICSRSMACHSE